MRTIFIDSRQAPDTNIVILESGPKSFRVKNILAERSGYFRAPLTGGFLESHASTIDFGEHTQVIDEKEQQKLQIIWYYLFLDKDI